MSIIECPECKGTMSSLAHACPNCGYPNSVSGAQTLGEQKKVGRNRRIAYLVCSLISLTGVYVALGPFIALHEIKIGLQEQDSARLEAYIDFPKLRANLKDQLNAAVERQTATELKDNPFAAFGMAIASKLTDSLIDSFVTPGGLANLATGQTVQREQAPNSNSSDQTSVREHPPQPFEDARYSYDSLNTFSVLVGSQGSDRVRFAFSREGLSWKLTNIIIPFGGLESPGTPPVTDAATASNAPECIGKFNFPNGETALPLGTLQTIDWEMPDGDTYYDIQLELLTDGGDVIGSVINWNWIKYDPTHTAGWDARTLYNWNQQEQPSKLDLQLKPGLYKFRLTYEYQNQQDHHGTCPLKGEFESNLFTLTE